MEDIFQLMSDLKIHIVALQDTGHIITTKQSKRVYGDYQVFSFQFGENPCDTVALVLDEGIFHHIVKSTNTTLTSQKARAIAIKLPAIIGNTGSSAFYVVNTYAPTKRTHQAEYTKELVAFLNTHQITPQNSVVVGDLNDYLLADLDRWSNKPSACREQRSKVLNPLKNKGFEDAFRTTHPYCACSADLETTI